MKKLKGIEIIATLLVLGAVATIASPSLNAATPESTDAKALVGELRSMAQAEPSPAGKPEAEAHAKAQSKAVPIQSWVSGSGWSYYSNADGCTQWARNSLQYMVIHEGASMLCGKIDFIATYTQVREGAYQYQAVLLCAPKASPSPSANRAATCAALLDSMTGSMWQKTREFSAAQYKELDCKAVENDREAQPQSMSAPDFNTVVCQELKVSGKSEKSGSVDP